MIFRKPYAILIKNFKLIHTILTVVMCYLIFHTFELNNFFNEYMKTTMLPLGRGTAEQLFSSQMYIQPFIIIGFSIIMFITLSRKEKPKALYSFLIVIYGALFAIFNFINAQVLYLEENILPAKDIRFLSDITLLILIPQVILIMFLLVRSIGFDIKKFDFKKDLLDMDIQDTDNEEFEVSVSVDGNIFKRNFNKTLRNLKYLYLENKMVFAVISLIAISFLTYNTYKKLNLESKILKENGEAFTVGNITLQVKNSYITQKNYSNKIITNGNYVLVRVMTQSYKLSEKLNFAKMQLKTGNNVYYPVEKNLTEEFIDLGQVYTDQYLTTKEFKTYLLVYELPLGESTKNMTFRYITDKTEESVNFITIGLKPEKLDELSNKKEIKLNEKSELNKEMFGKSTIEFNSFELDKYFTQNYNYCITSGDCFASKEYIRPKFNENYDKAIMKITGNLNFDDDYSIYGIKNLSTFITEFGTLVYTYNNVTFKTHNGLTWVTPKKYSKKSEYFLEINENVLNADNVYLLLQIRDQEFKIYIKK